MMCRIPSPTTSASPSTATTAAGRRSTCAYKATLIGAALIAGALAFGLGWGEAAEVAKSRNKRQLGLEHERDNSYDAEYWRERARVDLKFLHREILLAGNPKHQQALGKLHDLFYDFLRWEELRTKPKEAVHSALIKYLPKPDKNGVHPERWIYWPTLRGVPKVQDGPNTEIAKLFHDGDLLRPPDKGGVLVRIKGTGNIKCAMLPRDHLKSSIGHYAMNIQEVIRDPAVRIINRCGDEELGKRFLALTQLAFERNESFRSLFGHLFPDGGEEIWNQEAMQVITDVRRGKEPTISTFGMRSNVTGSHGDRLTFDDIVTKQNMNQQEFIKSQIGEMAFVADVDFKILNLGTIYHETDAHSLFIRPKKDGPGAYDYSSFMVATIEDAEGRPIWDEHFTPMEIEVRRALSPDDQFYFTQFWNNPFVAQGQGFHRDWIKVPYEGEPEQIAAEKKLDLLVTVDPANKVKKKNDYTAASIHGQDWEKGQIYLLDGLRDKIPSEKMVTELFDLIEPWIRRARAYGGSVKVGIEEVAFVDFLKLAMEDEMRKRELHFAIEPLKTKNVSKIDRIKRLARPYSTGMFLWPRTIMKTAVSGLPYDLIEVLRQEYLKFPNAADEDLFDTVAYVLDIMRPFPTPGTLKPRSAPQQPDVQTREQALRDERQRNAAGRHVPANVARQLKQADQSYRNRSGIGGQGRYMPGGRA